MNPEIEKLSTSSITFVLTKEMREAQTPQEDMLGDVFCAARCLERVRDRIVSGNPKEALRDLESARSMISILHREISDG